MTSLKNIQIQQLINLILLTILAYSYNLLYPSPITIITLIIFAIFLELTINYLQKKELYIPYSAAITALGIVLMLGWSLWYIPYILILVAILQKKFLTIESHHIFNPSNFALIMALLLFYPKALPIIGQLGKDIITLYIVIILGSIILIRVKRWMISLSFVLTFLLTHLFIFKHYDPHWQIEEFLLKFYSTSFIVYIFFMLTDPKTTPASSYLQVLFGFLVAFFTLLLELFIGVHLRNIFIALFFTSALCFICSYPIKSKKIYLLLLLFTTIVSVIILMQAPKYFVVN